MEFTWLVGKHPYAFEYSCTVPTIWNPFDNSEDGAKEAMKSDHTFPFSSAFPHSNNLQQYYSLLRQMSNSLLILFTWNDAGKYINAAGFTPFLHTSQLHVDSTQIGHHVTQALATPPSMPESDRLLPLNTVGTTFAQSVPVVSEGDEWWTMLKITSTKTQLQPDVVSEDQKGSKTNRALIDTTPRCTTLEGKHYCSLEVMKLVETWIRQSQKRSWTAWWTNVDGNIS